MALRRFGLEHPYGGQSREAYIESACRSCFAEMFVGQAVVRCVAIGCELVMVALEAPDSVFMQCDSEALERVRRRLGVRRVQVVPWNANRETLIRNALAPLIVGEVLSFEGPLPRVIAITAEDQTSADDGRFGESLGLASVIADVDLDVMSLRQFHSRVSKARLEFANHPQIGPLLAAALVRLGFLSRDDLAVIDPDFLAELGHLQPSEVASIIQWCEGAQES